LLTLSIFLYAYEVEQLHWRKRTESNILRYQLSDLMDEQSDGYSTNPIVFQIQTHIIIIPAILFGW